MSKTLKTILIVLAGLVLIGVGFVVARALQAPNPISHDTTFSILVKVNGDFAVNMAPKNPVTGEVEVEVSKGQPAVFQITNVPSGGFDIDILYSAYGLPDGMVSFSKNPVAAGESTTMTVNTAGLRSNVTYVCALTATGQ